MAWGAVSVGLHQELKAPCRWRLPLAAGEKMKKSRPLMSQRGHKVGNTKRALDKEISNAHKLTTEQLSSRAASYFSMAAVAFHLAYSAVEAGAPSARMKAFVEEAAAITVTSVSVSSFISENFPALPKPNYLR